MRKMGKQKRVLVGGAHYLHGMACRDEHMLSLTLEGWAGGSCRRKQANSEVSAWVLDSVRKPLYSSHP